MKDSSTNGSSLSSWLGMLSSFSTTSFRVFAAFSNSSLCKLLGVLKLSVSGAGVFLGTLKTLVDASDVLFWFCGISMVSSSVSSK